MRVFRLKDVTRRLGAALGVIGAVSFAAACDDSDLFGDGNNNGTNTPPSITTLSGPETIRAGETLFIDVIATGERPIEAIELTITTGAISRDTVIEVSEATSIDETLEIEMPATLSGTEVVVTARARDTNDLLSEPREVTISVEDAEAPTVEILRPSGPLQTGGDTTAVGTGADVRVEARVTDPSGISEVRFIGLALRGDPELGTDTIVTRFSERVVTFPRPGVDTLPTDTVIRRDLDQVGDSTESVLIIVEATDLFGNVTSDTVPVIVGGPDVQIVRPTDGGTHNEATDLTVRVAIADPGGIETATLIFSGAANDTVELAVTGLPTVDTVTFVLPQAQINTGTLTISASASNTRGIAAPATPVTIEVVAGGTAESETPDVSYTIDPLPRLTAPLPRREMLDTITITASADDQGGSGVVQLGIIVDAFVDSGDEVAQLTFVQNYATPRSNPDTTVSFSLRDVYDDINAALASSVALPDSLELRVRAFAFDAAGNSDTTNIPVDGFSTRGYILTVAGFTARLPGRGIISDAVIDTTANEERLFLSNFTQSRVDVLDLRDTTFANGGILAGAQPWGLFIDLSGDTLIVANSGGTNLSKIDLRDPALDEVVTERVHTPEAVIFELRRELDEQLNPRYSQTFFGYSDRPQFVAQAISTALFYSTVPTPAAEDGTIRMAIKQPGWLAYEDYFLFPGGDPVDESITDAFVIMNVDDVGTVATDSGDVIQVLDHLPGFPNVRIFYEGDDATIDSIGRSLGSDIIVCNGALLPAAVGVQDTTFVAASGDESWIAFGEGATAEQGRIIMFDGSDTEPLIPECEPNGQSDEVQITDLVHNAAERVTGLGLNENGTLGVARGDFAAYYFDRSLRLEGTYSEDINPGGFGAALHPDHDTESAGSTAETLSFVGTAEATIKIIDTYHFFARGEVPIRDPIVGPLRPTRPIPGFDNVGLVCPGDPRCIVVKLFGVTQSVGATRPDGVVIIDVRERDIE